MNDSNAFSNKLNTQSVLSMKSSGYYSQKTIGAKIAIDAVQPLVENAINEIPKNIILRLADFGSADGGTSQQMWYNIIKKIRAKENRKIEILYTDLASNDFSTLFRTMQGMEGNNQFAYQNLFKDIYVHGCGTGFHKQLMHDKSLSLGFSATAMHYVSEKPCHIKDHVHMVGASIEEKENFKIQASKDWESILISRAKELISGGRFICINFGIDEKGRYLGNTGGHNMFDKFAFYWKDLQKKSIITKDEFVAATFTQYYRTVEEFRMPFDDPNSNISKAGLRLKSCTTMITECPYKINYEKNKNTITSTQYAENLIPTLRSWSETVFRTALNGREENKINEIVNKFYKAYQDEVSINPEGHAMDYVHVILDIEKI